MKSCEFTVFAMSTSSTSNFKFRNNPKLNILTDQEVMVKFWKFQIPEIFSKYSDSKTHSISILKRKREIKALGLFLKSEGSQIRVCIFFIFDFK